MPQHLVIVGNGIAGATAARHARKADPAARITMISEEGLQPFSRTALMYVYMGTLTREHTELYPERFWTDNRIDRVLDRAVSLDTDAHTLTLADGGALGYDRLLVATGARTAVPPWPGADLPGVQGLVHWQDLDRLEAATPTARRGVVIGGGLIGVEFAEMLTVRGIPTTFLVRDDLYLGASFTRPESDLIEAAIRAHGVDLRMSTEAERFEGGARPGRPGQAVETVVLTDGERLQADVVGVGTGVRANHEWLGDAVETDGGVLVDLEMRTSAPDVFAAGDVAVLRDPPEGVAARQPIWYRARLQGALAGLGMTGHARAFAPGVFYNSAKFFDLEWQTYGAAGGADPAPGSGDWFWQGDARVSSGRSLRIRHDADGRVLGVNALGVRLRQETCARWIAEGWSVDRAVGDLRAARFDPEFSSAPYLAA